jgi:putative transposase
MTGKGRSNDNAYIERLWRSLKYEKIYIHDYKTIKELKNQLPKIIEWYNNERPRQVLDYLTPKEKAAAFVDKLSNLPTTTQPKQQLVFY